MRIKKSQLLMEADIHCLHCNAFNQTDKFEFKASFDFECKECGHQNNHTYVVFSKVCVNESSTGAKGTRQFSQILTYDHKTDELG